MFSTDEKDLSDSCSVLITKMSSIVHLKRIPTVTLFPFSTSSSVLCLTGTSFFWAQVIISCSIKANITICDIFFVFVFLIFN